MQQNLVSIIVPVYNAGNYMHGRSTDLSGLGAPADR